MRLVVNLKHLLRFVVNINNINSVSEVNMVRRNSMFVVSPRFVCDRCKRVFVVMYVFVCVCVCVKDYTMDFFFRQTWIDRRLAFDGVNELVIGSDMLHKIWIPDTFIANDRKTYFHKATVQNKFIRIQPDGQVLYSMR